MLKVAASLSKKVPIEGMEYSSQSFCAGLEIELSDGFTGEQIRQRITEVYALLEQTIDGEITKRNNGHAPVAGQQTNALGGVQSGVGSPFTKRGNGTNGKGLATEAQRKAIFAISRALGARQDEVNQLVRETYGVDSPDALTVKQASQLIDQLKSYQQENAGRNI